MFRLMDKEIINFTPKELRALRAYFGPPRPTLKIFLFPLTRPSFTGMGRSVGKLLYFTPHIRYPLNQIVNSATLGNNI